MHIRALNSNALKVALVSSLLSLACSGQETPTGQVKLALSSTVDEQTYLLRDASFSITDSTTSDTWTLSSEEAPDSTLLTQALPVGTYELMLEEGWRLEKQGDEPTTVAASLVSPNPTVFGIEPGAATLVSYLFETAETSVGFGAGELQIEIEVEHIALPELIITEIMKNPSVLTDAEGEWFEIYNAGASAVDLNGCILRRDDTQTTIDASLIVDAGDFATIASAPDPGFTPDRIWSSLSLPNSAAVRVALECHATVIDEVTFDSASFPNDAGKSLSLDPTQLSTSSNDLGGNWCSGSVEYNGDFGSPGAINPSCE